MTCFVLQWRDYLKGFKADSFEDHCDALAFHGKLDFSIQDPNVSTFLVLDDMSLRSPNMSAAMRRDLYELMLSDGVELAPDRKISAEDLYLRLDLWMKE